MWKSILVRAICGVMLLWTLMTDGDNHCYMCVFSDLCRRQCVLLKTCSCAVGSTSGPSPSVDAGWLGGSCLWSGASPSPSSLSDKVCSVFHVFVYVDVTLSLCSDRAQCAEMLDSRV